jgi:hypothetical protein
MLGNPSSVCSNSKPQAQARADSEGTTDCDSNLSRAVEFHLLKGPEAEDHTFFYGSHTAWENRAVFEVWTKSEAFRAAHSRAGDNKPLYLITRGLRGSRCVRRWDAARRRDTYLLSSVREL